MIKILLVFCVVFLNDFIWTIYIKRVQQRKAFFAALYSMIIYGFSSIVILQYIENNWLLIPALIGAFFGTLVAMKYE